MQASLDVLFTRLPPVIMYVRIPFASIQYSAQVNVNEVFDDVTRQIVMSLAAGEPARHKEHCITM